MNCYIYCVTFHSLYCKCHLHDNGSRNASLGDMVSPTLRLRRISEVYIALKMGNTELSSSDGTLCWDSSLSRTGTDTPLSHTWLDSLHHPECTLYQQINCLKLSQVTGANSCYNDNRSLTSFVEISILLLIMLCWPKWISNHLLCVKLLTTVKLSPGLGLWLG